MGEGGVEARSVEVEEGIEVRRLDCMQCTCFQLAERGISSTEWNCMCKMASRDDMKSIRRVNKSTEISILSLYPFIKYRTGWTTSTTP